MDKVSFNNLITEALRLGESIIDLESVDLAQIESYQSKILDIAENGLKLSKDQVQLKACMIMMDKRVEDYRLSIFEKIFNTYSQGYYGKVNSKNSDTQIRKRYAVDMNRYLPMLKIKKIAASNHNRN